MRKRFPGYFQPSHDELDEMLKSALISVDTNFLLNLYKFTPKAREHCFRILEIAKDRLWIPHHVAQEYLKRYHVKIREQLKEYERVHTLFSSLPQKVDSLKEHPFLDHDELIKTVTECSKSMTDLVEAQATAVLGSGDVPTNFKKTALKVHERIADLFDGRVGDPYEKDQQAAKEKEIDERYENSIPPGFLDAGKGENRFGDALIWFQLLDRLKSFTEEHKPSGLIFVTNESDKDWWWLEDEQRVDTKIGPHHKLVDEMKTTAGIGFYIYSGPQFLENMSRMYSIEVDEKTEGEIKSVSASLQSNASGVVLKREYMPREFPEILHDTLLEQINEAAKLLEVTTGRMIEREILFPAMFDKPLEDIWMAGLLSDKQKDDVTVFLRIAIKTSKIGGTIKDYEYAILAAKRGIAILRLSVARMNEGD